MPRPPRHHLAGATYHVMLRGNNGQLIFQSDADRCRLCLMIQESSEKYGFQVVSFCFMTNHIHLAIEVDDVSLSAIFQSLAGRYSRYYNWKYKTRGHLFQGRFHSILVAQEIYLRRVIRYIHLNPIGAGLADSPEAYRWSSHAAYLDDAAFTWLSPSRGLEHFGQSPNNQLAHFRDYIRGELTQEEVIEFATACRIGVLGDADFVERVTKRVGTAPPLQGVTLQALVDAVSERFGIEPAALSSPNRNHEIAQIRAISGHLAKLAPGISVKELAAFFGQSPAALSQSTTRLTRKLASSPTLSSHIDAIRHALDP